MGAEQFECDACGRGPREAFNRAVKEAQYQYGHAGYTGTIAEKDSFVVIDVPDEWRKKPDKYAEHLLDVGDERIDDKWGPAGCVELATGPNDKEKTYRFFGWASC